MVIDKKYIITIVAVIVAFLLALFAGVKYLAPALTTTHTTATTTEKQPIYITGTATTDTKIQYVKGETVYLPSPATNTGLITPVSNTPGATSAKLDGKFDIGKTDFTYMVNGKVGKFTKMDDEKYIFDKNMVDLKQTSEIKIVAEIPTIDLTRHSVLTLGGMYVDGKITPAVGYTGSMGRIGAYQIIAGQKGQYVGVGIKF